jgi:hydrophobic/amphiphilic exporter-1 (mainly G- bacteria), HAE1 family
MNLADLSVKRPVFITSVVVLMLVAGLMFLKRLPVDLFPDVTFPIVVVNVPYRGAGPAEIETLIAKPLENEISTISGIKRLNSIAQEGVGTIVAEFNLDVDIKILNTQKIKSELLSRAQKENCLMISMNPSSDVWILPINRS